jgi:hypothetical protein
MDVKEEAVDALENGVLDQTIEGLRYEAPLCCRPGKEG